MTETPKVEKIYRCNKCKFKFPIPLRLEFADGEYNACRQCKSLYIQPLYLVSGVGEFEYESDAYSAYFDFTEEFDNENKM